MKMTDQSLKIEVGSIVSGLISTESVEITKIQALGTKYSLSFTGVNSRRAGSVIVTRERINALELLTTDGVFNFKGDHHLQIQLLHPPQRPIRR